MPAKILILDIECLPNIAYVWRFFKENISPKQVLQSSTLLSYAAKWLGHERVFYGDTSQFSEKVLLKGLIGLLDDADVVVAHYGDKFDIPRIKARALVHGLKPPSPFKSVDTKLVASRQFNFEGNSLAYLAQVLGCTPKLAHKKFPGFELWAECMKGNPEAFEECREYNIQDVLTLEEIYLKMLPWINNHPNHGVYDEDQEVCPKCGSKHMQRRGFYRTDVRVYQRYQCQNCGGWSRSRIQDKEKKNNRIMVNAV